MPPPVAPSKPSPSSSPQNCPSSGLWLSLSLSPSLLSSAGERKKKKKKGYKITTRKSLSYSPHLILVPHFLYLLSHSLSPPSIHKTHFCASQFDLEVVHCLDAMKLKNPSNSASQTLTSSETRLLVRETLRISANLASAPPPSPSAAAPQDRPLLQDSSFGGLVEDQFLNSSLRLICCEEIDGRRWQYFAEDYNVGGGSAGSKHLKKNSIRAVSLQTPLSPADVSSNRFLCCFSFLFLL